jgi:hypothetical protein
MKDYYTVIVVKNKDIINGEHFTNEDIELVMDGEILYLATGTKRKDEDIIDTQAKVVGDYRDLARVNMVLTNRAYVEWLNQKENNK